MPGGWPWFVVFSFACQLPLVVVGAVREHGLNIVIWAFGYSFLCLLWPGLRWFPYIGCFLLLCSIYYYYYYFSEIPVVFTVLTFVGLQVMSSIFLSVAMMWLAIRLSWSRSWSSFSFL